VPVEVVFQELDRLPEGFRPCEGRTKPWGTGHAVLMGKDAIREPFGVINADDYYGTDSFKVLADSLRALEGKSGEYCMVGFNIGNTLSENGGVTRGICSVDEKQHLTKVIETKNIVKTSEGAAVQNGDGSLVPVAADCPVSMNMWGFTPEIFQVLETGFADFLQHSADKMKGEYLIPTIVDRLIQKKRANVTVLESRDKWFGVTYREDKPEVVRSFRKLIDAGVYKEKLFD